MTNSEKCSLAVQYLNVLVPHIAEFEDHEASLIRRIHENMLCAFKHGPNERTLSWLRKNAERYQA